MEQTIVLRAATGDLVLIYNDGRVVFIEPDGECLELEAEQPGTDAPKRKNA
jgi:hypothetical protein